MAYNGLKTRLAAILQFRFRAISSQRLFLSSITSGRGIFTHPHCGANLTARITTGPPTSSGNGGDPGGSSWGGSWRAELRNGRYSYPNRSIQTPAASAYPAAARLPIINLIIADLHPGVRECIPGLRPRGFYLSILPIVG